MSSTALSIASAALILTACASSAPPLPASSPRPQASLLTPCSDLPRLDSAELRALVVVTIETARRYHECAARHRRLAQWAADPDGVEPSP